MIIWVLEALISVIMAYLVIVGMEYLWPVDPVGPVQPVPVDDES